MEATTGDALIGPRSPELTEGSADLQKGFRLERPLRALGVLGAGFLAAGFGCSEPAAVVQGADLPLLDPAADWVGVYRGSGQGTLEGLPVVVQDAVVTVVFDADDVKIPQCPNCVTVTLDDIFHLANVRVDNLTGMDLTYLDGAVRHTLELRRFTLGIDNPNVLRARATYGNDGVATPILDIEYTLER